MEPESLDEQALQETVNDPPEYHHPDEWTSEDQANWEKEWFGAVSRVFKKETGKSLPELFAEYENGIPDDH